MIERASPGDSLTRRVRVHPADRLAAAVAGEVSGALRRAIEARGVARWVLAGGSTPAGLYADLASRHAASVDWSRVEFYWGDERAVAGDDADSNYGAARAVLLAPLGVDPRRIHRIRGELGATPAARDYEATVARALAAGEWDLVLLGLGADGHTASLFPPTGADARSRSWVVATTAPAPPRERISLTLGALNRSRRTMLLVSGESKAEAVRRVLGGDEALPATHLAAADGTTTWYLDPEAARVQSPSSREE